MEKKHFNFSDKARLLAFAAEVASTAAIDAAVDTRTDEPHFSSTYWSNAETLIRSRGLPTHEEKMVVELVYQFNYWAGERGVWDDTP